jgi:hypothetical protein
MLVQLQTGEIVNTDWIVAIVKSPLKDYKSLMILIRGETSLELHFANETVQDLYNVIQIEQQRCNPARNCV